MHCGDYNRNEPIEIGAEVFAAEFIYPEHEFAELVKASGVASWRPEDVVILKRRTPAKISYMFVQKRLERLGVVERGAFVSVRFKKLEEQMFGVPGWKARMMRRRAMGY